MSSIAPLVLACTAYSAPGLSHRAWALTPTVVGALGPNRHHRWNPSCGRPVTQASEEPEAQEGSEEHLEERAAASEATTEQREGHTPSRRVYTPPFDKSFE